MYGFEDGKSLLEPTLQEFVRGPNPHGVIVAAYFIKQMMNHRYPMRLELRLIAGDQNTITQTFSGFLQEG